ncbi:hypothetical protein B0H16DRAFT_1768691 [Mycena metata]|uniref:Uncharacterized protein n=1 Tax=Mycena metata TaxID=1033252 RepID=A0AAD7I296_9AGAR|nr:hypothetical protein B0H16DRAFT_1768691 [Mycena metata]
MEYLNYDVAIREGKGVELAGWPADIKLADHANWSAETLRRLRASLLSGGIHWIKMTKAQHDELVAEHNTQREALGAGSLRPRKQRSDKGEARGPQKNKRQAAAGKRKGSRREEEEEDDDDDGSDGDDNDKEDDAAPIEQHAHVGATSALTAPFTHVAGVGLTSSLATATPALATQSFNMGAIPELNVLPEHLPSFPTDGFPEDFDFDSPEFLEMLNDPTAWMAAEGGSIASQTHAGAMAFVATPRSLDPSTCAPTPSSNAGVNATVTAPFSLGQSSTSTPADASGNSKCKRAAEDKSTERGSKSKKGERAADCGQWGSRKEATQEALRCWPAQGPPQGQNWGWEHGVTGSTCRAELPGGGIDGLMAAIRRLGAPPPLLKILKIMDTHTDIKARWRAAAIDGSNSEVIKDIENTHRHQARWRAAVIDGNH